jgi:hypothetical protein
LFNFSASQVMGKVERLHSERLRLPWTAAEDDLAARLRLLTNQLQHPAHPVNALNHLGPVRPDIFLVYTRTATFQIPNTSTRSSNTVFIAARGHLRNLSCNRSVCDWLMRPCQQSATQVSQHQPLL